MSVFVEEIRDDDPVTIAATALFAYMISKPLQNPRDQPKKSFWSRFRNGLEPYPGPGKFDAVHYKTVVWRGGAFPNEHINFYEVGKKFRVPGFFATSVNQETALQFREHAAKKDGLPGILWIVKVRVRVRLRSCFLDTRLVTPCTNITR